MNHYTVTVVGATGTLGGYIVKALLDKGIHVRAVVRWTSDRSKLKMLGVTEFIVADLNDSASLHRAMAVEPVSLAVIASAAGFSSHSALTKGDNSRADTEGYRNLVDAAQAAKIGRFIFISIIECDKAVNVPHFYQKFETEKYLANRGIPFLALRGGAFLDRAKDVVYDKVKKGIFPDILPDAPVTLTYSKELAQRAVQAALDLPLSAMNQSVDIGSNQPATGEMIAAAFTRVMGRTVVAKRVFPRYVFLLLPLIACFLPRLRDNLAVLRWLKKGNYVSHDTQKQYLLFGHLPSVEDIVRKYCQDAGLINSENKNT